MQGLEFVARIKPRSLAPFRDATSRHWLEQNCRLAAKHGLEAEIFDPYWQRACRLRDFAAEMLDVARPGITASGNAGWLDTIEELICPADTALTPIKHPIAIRGEK
jgi:gamma-glutamyl:cysteine ligase YbdK (ATP-grasp superfamily)